MGRGAKAFTNDHSEAWKTEKESVTNKLIFVDKPWGHEEIWAHTDRYVGKRLYIESGSRLSRQYHEKKDETVWVMSGVLLLEIGEDDVQMITMLPGESYHIEPGTVHRFTAAEEDVELIEVSTPELEDVVRLEDDYGRIPDIIA
jgi:mannose-6-phosphate isomerase-like protein (cupin superfamily)